MFSKVFVVRVLEESAAAGLAAFSGSVVAGGSFSVSPLSGGLTAAGMAVLGVIRKNVGESDRPTVK